MNSIWKTPMTTGLVIVIAITSAMLLAGAPAADVRAIQLATVVGNFDRAKTGPSQGRKGTEEPQVFGTPAVLQADAFSTERGGFEMGQFANLLKTLYLQQKSREFKDLESLRSLLISHGFLLFRDAD